MKQHPAAQEYEDIAIRLDKVLNTIEELDKEMTSIQNELIRNGKIYKEYEKEVFEDYVKDFQKKNPDYTLEDLLKSHKKGISALKIKVDKEKIKFLAEETVFMLASYVTETEK